MGQLVNSPNGDGVVYNRHAVAGVHRPLRSVSSRRDAASCLRCSSLSSSVSSAGGPSTSCWSSRRPCLSAHLRSRPFGLAVTDGFPAMPREAAGFKHGEAAYVNVMVWSAVTFQLGVLGGTGVLFLASTVLVGVLNAVRVPLTSIAAVIWFHDPMSGFKILALVITVWGFASYMVGHSSLKETSPN
ncbi:hypothetical protein EJB05_43950, partial [Eragrostis curvula]